VALLGSLLLFPNRSLSVKIAVGSGLLTLILIPYRLQHRQGRRFFVVKIGYSAFVAALIYAVWRLPFTIYPGAVRLASLAVFPFAPPRPVLVGCVPENDGHARQQLKGRRRMAGLSAPS
jgi:hypothetical protein